MNADEYLRSIANAVHDGRSIDWAAAEDSAPDDSCRRAVRELRVVAEIAALHAGAPPDTSATIAPQGASLGSWKSLTLLERIGEGVYGEVYRAWDPRLDREVALKLLRARDDGTVDVVHEARLLARVRQANVVTVYGADQSDGRVGIWMEFIRGQTLEDVLAVQGPFSAAEAATIGGAICQALSAVHAADLVHRDIKAQNVMREAGGRIVLMDFGAGLHVRADFRPAGLHGTPLYLAPELLNGGGAARTTDIYSVGVLLYHLVTGGYPVDGDTLEAVCDAHRTGRRRHLRDVRPDLPPAFVRAIERALSVDPANRFESAGALETALADAASRPADGRPLAVRGGGRRVAYAAAAVLMLALAVGIAVFDAATIRSSLTRLVRPRPPTTGTIPTDGVRLRRLKRQEWTFTGRPSPDGRFLSFVDQTGDLCLYEPATGESRKLTNKGESDEHAESQIAISPDGTRIAYAWAALDGVVELRIAEIDGRRPRVLLRRTDVLFPSPVQWFRSASEILSLLEMADGRIVLAAIGEETGQLRVIRALDSLPDAVSLSADDHFIAYDVPNADDPGQHVVIVDALTGAETDHIERRGTDEYPLWTVGGDLLFASDRGGSVDLWRASVRGGRQSGRSQLLRRDMGRYWPLGLTDTGALFHLVQTGVVDVYTARADFSKPAVIGEAQPITPDSMGSNMSSGWSPDSRYLAYVAIRGSPARERRTLVIRDMGSRAERRITLPLVHYVMPRWSPDGRTILIHGVDLRGNEHVYFVDVESGRARAVLPIVVNGKRAVGAFIWSPDGASLWYDKTNDGLYARQLDTGAETKLIDYRQEGLLTLAGTPDCLRVSPDGRWLAYRGFLRNAPEPDTIVLRIRPVEAPGPFREVLRAVQPDRFLLQPWSPDSRELLVTRFIKGAQHAQGLYRLTIDNPTLVETPFKMDARYMELSSDGRWMTFTSGATTQELWVMENFLERDR